MISKEISSYVGLKGVVKSVKRQPTEMNIKNGHSRNAHKNETYDLKNVLTNTEASQEVNALSNVKSFDANESNPQDKKAPYPEIGVTEQVNDVLFLPLSLRKPVNQEKNHNSKVFE